jgi:hypothetical protein
MSDYRKAVRRFRERGTTYIELSMMSLIAAILLVSLSQAITATTRGAIAAKERARAQSLAQDQLEEVKNLGFPTLSMRVSNYWYPDKPDPANPLMQVATALPYPTTAPSPGEDPWTPEVILIGKRSYWRHVVVKFVQPDPDVAGSGQLVQAPKPSVGGYPTKGGNNPGSNLAYIEVDVTWFSQRMGRVEQVRLATMLANPNVSTLAFGSISGTILDTGALPELNATPGDALTRDADDKPITWSALVVMARNILTNEKYSSTIDTTKTNLGEYGYYMINNVPNGSYEVLVFGAPKFYDGGYNGKNTIASEGIQTVSVTVGSSSMQVKNINIWLKKTLLVKIYGAFIGVDGKCSTPGDDFCNAKKIQVYNSDFSSVPLELTVTQTCDSSAPCWFVLNDVAWPATGKALWKTMLINMTDKVGTGVTICADSLIAAPSSATDFYLAPSYPAGAGDPCSAGCKAAYPSLGSDCIYPDVSVPVALSSGFQKARLKVKVKEYYDGQDWDLAAGAIPMVRVSFLSVNDGLSATLGLNSDSVTIFENAKTGEGLIPLQPSPYIKLRAWITTTGYSEDSYFLPFDTLSGVDYNLIVGGDWAEPPENQRYTFRLIRTSTISGTVWLVSGTKGFVNASVRIQLQSADWNNVVTTDGSGRFVHDTVPMNSKTAYVVSPIAGSDYISNPTQRTVLVDKNGLVYSRDISSNPLEFVLTAINGVITGTVKKGGVPVTEGAMVIASTYNGAFPSSFPAAALSAAYTYSTVTYSDGSFRLKVGTGLGKYYIYAYTMQGGGGEASIGPVPATGITVTPGTEAVYDPLIP